MTDVRGFIAAANGDVDTLKQCELSQTTLFIAIQHGNLDAVVYIHEKLGTMCKTLSEFATGMHPDITNDGTDRHFRYIHEGLVSPDWPTTTHVRGNVEVLKYVHGVTGRVIAAALYNAIISDSYDCIEYIVQCYEAKVPGLDKQEPGLEGLMLKYSSVNTMRLLVERYGATFDSDIVGNRMPYDEAVAVYLCDTYPPNVTTMNFAARCGNVDVMHLLHSRYNVMSVEAICFGAVYNTTDFVMRVAHEICPYGPSGHLGQVIIRGNASVQCAEYALELGTTFDCAISTAMAARISPDLMTFLRANGMRVSTAAT